MAINYLRPAVDSHIVPVKPFLLPLRIAQFILALIILIFVAVPTHDWYLFDMTAFGFSLFTACATFIIIGYYILSAIRFPVAYNRWAVLGLDIFGAIFWLVSFALLASWTSDHAIPDWLTEYRGINRYQASWALAGTAAGLGAVEFVLFLITLIFYSIALHQHRMQGYHSAYGSARTAPPAGATSIEIQAVPSKVRSADEEKDEEV